MSEDHNILTTGDALPEEVDGHLHALNRVRGRVTEAAADFSEEVRKGRTRFAVLNHDGFIAMTKLRDALDEHEKLMSGGEG